MKVPSVRFGRWSLSLQEFDVTIIYKSGRGHSDADCLSRARVDLPPLDSDEDGAFFCIPTESDLAPQQRADPELRLMIDKLEGRHIAMPRAFKRNYAAFCLINSVLVKRNFDSRTITNYPVVIIAGLRDEISEVCRD